jgi:hypothetical protein
MRFAATHWKSTGATAFVAATAASTARRPLPLGSPSAGDHLLPKGHPDRDSPDYIVTSCMFCNTADNRYFDLALERGLRFDGLTPEELVDLRRPYVERTREGYRTFWREYVRPSGELC